MHPVHAKHHKPVDLFPRDNLGMRLEVTGSIAVSPAWSASRFKESKAKEINIWEKVLTAAKDERVSEEFFFMNDDYFFLKPFKMQGFPWYHKGDIRKMNLKPEGYDRRVLKTADVLEKSALSTWHYDVHTPNAIVKEKFIRAYNAFKGHLGSTGEGLTINTCIGNFNCEIPVFKTDRKLTGKELAWLKANRDKELLFSVFDNAQTDEFKAYMNELYPDKSFFEA
jgi:hypothetical protein